MTTIELILIAGLCVLAMLCIAIWLRIGASSGQHQQEQFQALLAQLQQAHVQQAAAQERMERIERSLREQIQLTSQATRQELGANFLQFQQGLNSQLSSVATIQNNQIDGFSQQLVKLNENNAAQLEQMRLALSTQAQTARDEQALSLKRLTDSLNLTLNQTLTSLTESNAQRLNEIRSTLEQKSFGARSLARGRSCDFLFFFIRQYQ